MKQEGILAKCHPGSNTGPALGGTRQPSLKQHQRSRAEKPRASRNPNWRRFLFLQAFVLVSLLARLMEEMAGRMGAQELTQLERVDE